MKELSRDRFRLVALAFALCAGSLSAQTEPSHEHHHHPMPQSPGSQEMAPTPPRPADTPEVKALKASFLLDHTLKANQRRMVFDKYFPTLGTDGMLQAFEERNAFCHNEAHELGRAVYAHFGDLGKALAACGTGCTSACLHGVLKEAFGNSTLEEISPRLASVCTEGSMKDIQRPGNCAHGMGHALMMVVDNDVEQAVKGCVGFGDDAMSYYCVTGIFMELFDQAPAWDRQNRPSSYPCDTYKAFPAACYRYQAPRLLQKLGGDRERLAEACRKLPAPERSGCFHGLGFTAVRWVADEPTRMANLCPTEPAADQTLCIEGVMESLAAFDAKLATAACATLQGDAQTVCGNAAREGMYRLKKATLPLYLPATP